ncbi:MAG: hypothetical protein IT379_30835 [Deltaproteobacteria bacterium]|nr:hypothetical protein [Deltaproteobacteria bacterium]
MPWSLALAAAVLALSLAGAVPATAQDEPPVLPPGGSEALFRQGVQAARDGRWPDALEAFSRSYALSPRPLTLMNLAGAQARTGRLLEATDGYRRFLVEATDERTRGYREAVARALREVEQRTPRVRLEIAGVLPTDRIAIDEREHLGNQTGAEIAVNPGEHRVVVRRGEPAMIVGRAQFSVSEGQRTRVAVPLGPPEPDTQPAPTRTVPPTVVVSPPVPSPREVAERDAERRRRLPVEREEDRDDGGSVLSSPVFWVVVGLVIAGGATAGVLAATSGGTPDPIPGNTTPSVIEVE